MKASYLFKTIYLTALVILCLCAGSAFSESDFFETSMELFTAGDFPEYISIQTFSGNDFDSYVYENLKKGTEYIDISAYEILPEDLSLTLTMVVNDHPDLFYVGSKIRYSSNGEYVKLYAPEYLFTGNDLKARQAAFDSSVEEIAAHAAKASTTIGKMLLVNDYFCTNYAYDNSLTIFRPDQLFSGGTGVCQAYMLGYAAVLDELGIANTHATSLAMKHTWNLVNLDEDWYHVDVTWNDPVPDTALQAGHRYFLLSDNGMENAKHYDWMSSVSAGSKTYDNCFWQDFYTPLATINNFIYYLSATADDGTRNLMKWNANTGSSSKIFNFNTVGQNHSYIRLTSHSPVAADSNCIYYASRGILWAVDHDGNNAIQVYTTGDDDIHIWSCFLEDNTLFMRIGKLNGETSVVSCPAIQPPFSIPESCIFEMLPGESMDLKVDTAASVTLSSSNTDVFIIDASNKLTAVDTGAAYLVVKKAAEADMKYPVIVHSPDQLIVPAGVIELAQESFSATAAVEILLPDSLRVIGPGVFADCDDLVIVHLPDDIESIDKTAFPNDSSLTLLCRDNTEGATFAADNGIPCVLIP